MAIKVSGPWNEGYVMDMYVEKSIYIQDDAFGSPIFNTTYTEIGKLLHSMKYNGHYDNSRAIADICTPFLEKIQRRKVEEIMKTGSLVGENPFHSSARGLIVREEGQ